MISQPWQVFCILVSGHCCLGFCLHFRRARTLVTSVQEVLERYATLLGEVRVGGRMQDRNGAHAQEGDRVCPVVVLLSSTAIADKILRDSSGLCPGPEPR